MSYALASPDSNSLWRAVAARSRRQRCSGPPGVFSNLALLVDESDRRLIADRTLIRISLRQHVYCRQRARSSHASRQLVRKE
jgi:hypothetical protein